MLGLRTSIVGLALLASGACAQPGYYSSCVQDSECPEGHACQTIGERPVCAPRCATDADCEVADTHPGVYCTVTGACAVECAVDGDCPPEAMCDAEVSACVRREG